MYRVAVLGDRESINGFASLGLSVFPVDEAQSATRKLEEMVTAGGFAVIFITEALYEQMLPHIQKYDALLLPAILPIPGVAGNTGIGMRQVHAAVEKAVGSDILENQKER